MMKVYFDSCIAIYLVEESPVYFATLEQRISELPPYKVCVSHLVEMECLVVPLRIKDRLLVQRFHDWFLSAEVFTITPDVFRKAAKLRADFPGLKTPDALHIAVANRNRVDEFWTNDNRLDKVAPGIVRNIFAANQSTS